MQTVITLIYLVLLLLLQNYLPFKVDLLLILVVIVSLRRRKGETLAYSFCGGFLLDSLAGVGFINTLSKTIAGVLLSIFRSFFELEDYYFTLLMVLILTPIVFLVEYLGLRYFYQYQISFLSSLLELMKLLALNLIFTPLIFLLFSKSVKK